MCRITYCDDPGTEHFRAACPNGHLADGWYCKDHGDSHIALLRKGQLYCSACWNAADKTVPARDIPMFALRELEAAA